MKLASWSVDDPLHQLPYLEGLRVELADDIVELALINGLPEPGVRTRIELGNRPYVTRLYGRPVAFGWAATDLAHIGEVGVSFQLPHAERYLWDLEVLPDGGDWTMYARLLEGMVLHEEAARFWLGHGPENLAAAAGARWAGFSEAGELSFRHGAGAVLSPTGSIELALAAAAVMGIAVAGTEGDLARAAECSHGPAPVAAQAHRGTAAGRACKWAAGQPAGTLRS